MPSSFLNMSMFLPFKTSCPPFMVGISNLLYPLLIKILIILFLWPGQTLVKAGSILLKFYFLKLQRECLSHGQETPHVCMLKVGFPFLQMTALLSCRKKSHLWVHPMGKEHPCPAGIYHPRRKPQSHWQGLRLKLIKFMFAIPQFSSGKQWSFQEIRLSYSCLIK